MQGERRRQRQRQRQRPHVQERCQAPAGAGAAHGQCLRPQGCPQCCNRAVPSSPAEEAAVHAPVGHGARHACRAAHAAQPGWGELEQQQPQQSARSAYSRHPPQSDLLRPETTGSQPKDHSMATHGAKHAQPAPHPPGMSGTSYSGSCSMQPSLRRFHPHGSRASNRLTAVSAPYLRAGAVRHCSAGRRSPAAHCSDLLPARAAHVQRALHHAAPLQHDKSGPPPHMYVSHSGGELVMPDQKERSRSWSSSAPRWPAAAAAMAV